MCGITGCWAMPGESANRLQDHVVAMACTLEHRGPDDSGFWLDESAGLALGFRRLAIIDLSPNGHQPMQSSSGRWVVVFNGEVYSFAELREELTAKGHRFRGHSDTEVVLEACEQWGVVEAVKRFIGMFAMALWDRRERRLYLVRDRLGIKPLYYAWAGRTLLFGSELKALRAHPAFDAEVDRDASACSCATTTCLHLFPSIGLHESCYQATSSAFRTGAGSKTAATGMPGRSLFAASNRFCPKIQRAFVNNSSRSCATQSSAAWWPMCHSASFFPGVSIHRLWLRSCRHSLKVLSAASASELTRAVTTRRRTPAA